MNALEKYMHIALTEAKKSLQEGNHGFGAVVVKSDTILAAAHDKDVTDQDPTAHAEMTAIRMAARKIGADLSGCLMVSTHEPCPMCSAAIAWSGITEIAYGFSIADAMKERRARINITISEVFTRANRELKEHANVLRDECKLLYMESIRSEVKRLRNATDEMLEKYNDDFRTARLDWFRQLDKSVIMKEHDSKMAAYKLLLCRLHIAEDEAPIISCENGKLVFHSKNFCPTLEACRILDLDTRHVCKKYNEDATDALMKCISDDLKFARNYDKLRPYSNYCEEMIMTDR